MARISTVAVVMGRHG